MIKDILLYIVETVILTREYINIGIDFHIIAKSPYGITLYPIVERNIRWILSRLNLIEHLTYYRFVFQYGTLSQARPIYNFIYNFSDSFLDQMDRLPFDVIVLYG